MSEGRKGKSTRDALEEKRGKKSAPRVPLNAVKIDSSCSLSCIPLMLCVLSIVCFNLFDCIFVCLCMWSNSQAAAGADYSHIENVKDPYQGGGAEWLKNPCWLEHDLRVPVGIFRHLLIFVGSCLNQVSFRILVATKRINDLIWSLELVET